MNFSRTSLILLFALLLAACRHPLVIQGEGDIIELNTGARGCALEEFWAQWARCTDNGVSNSETVRYRALPRPGWRFARWDGYCAAESRGKDCEITYDKASIEWWEELFPGRAAAPLTAIFARDDGAPIAAAYIASQFGARGRTRYTSLLDALFSINGSYRYTVQQASTGNDFDRNPAWFLRRADSMLLTGPTPSSLVPSGGATQAGDFLTLVDTNGSDGDISATYLQAEVSEMSSDALSGTYY